MNRRTARNGIHSRARSTARRIRSLAGPSGRRAPESLNPEVCKRASANRRSAASFSTRRRSVRISCRSSGSVSSFPLQTDHDRGRGAEPPTRRRARDTEIHGDGQVPGALDKIPEPMVIERCCGRDVVIMRMIIGRPLTPLNSSRTMRGVRRRDDNSRNKVQMSAGTARFVTRQSWWNLCRYPESSPDRFLQTLLELDHAPRCELVFQISAVPEVEGHVVRILSN